MTAEPRRTARTPLGDRPLADCLDTFWQGDVPAPTPPRPGLPAPAELGPSGITLRGRELTDLLGDAYRRFTEEV